jgi:hypothetical protein
VNHHHHGVEIAEESLLDHLATRQGTAMPETLSFGTTHGASTTGSIGEAHAADDRQTRLCSLGMGRVCCDEGARTPRVLAASTPGES